jgi:hypothetical protein
MGKLDEKSITGSVTVGIASGVVSYAVILASNGVLFSSTTPVIASATVVAGVLPIALGVAISAFVGAAIVGYFSK